MWGSMETARSEGLKSEVRRAERVEFLGRGCFPPHQLEDLESAAVSYLSGARDEAPVTTRFRTFYRLIKPLPMSILLIISSFQ